MQKFPNLKNPHHFLATLGGIGLFPLAPGTIGSIFGWVIFIILSHYVNMIFATIFIVFLAIYVTNIATKDLLKKDKDSFDTSNLSAAAAGLETAFGRPFGNVQPTPMLRFAEGGDVEMMDEEFVGDDELMMEEGVQIGPMAEDGETDVEVLMAMKVSPGLIDEYRNYVFELKELGMEHQIAPFRDWFNSTYGAARMGVKKGGKICLLYTSPSPRDS